MCGGDDERDEEEKRGGWEERWDAEVESRELPHSAAPAAREQTRGAKKTNLNYFINKNKNITYL